ncbi:MAG: hypothetical protein ACI9NT_000955 [Bacteroidia bacterium]|jgi:hypothetical protein
MNDSSNRRADKEKDKQIAGMLASAAIVFGFVFYWSLQIQSVLEMLELAYG